MGLLRLLIVLINYSTFANVTRTEVVQKLSESKYLSICKRLTKGRDYRDLHQELILHFLELPENLIHNIQKPDAYIYRTLLSMISKRGRFYEKYRTYYCEEIKEAKEDQPEEVKESDLTKVEIELNNLYWADKEILKIYLEKKTIRKTAKALNIPISSTKVIIDRAKQTIKHRMKKPKILIMMQHNITALQYHRQIVPHERLAVTNKEDFEFIYNRPSTANDEASIMWMTDAELKEYSMVIYLRQIAYNPDHIQPSIDRLKSLGIKILFDIDDYWKLPVNHYMYDMTQKVNYSATTTHSMKQVDWVTTTTETFANNITPYCSSVSVLPNCISSTDTQFTPRPIHNNRLRFAWIGGVYHKHDIRIMEESIQKLYKSKELNGKWQLCVGGYNPNPEYIEIEKVFTANYDFRLTDKTYYDYLYQQTPMMEHVSFDKPYRRLWGKSITTYGELYNEIDVALIPLIDEPFNNCKSELKIVEAGTMKKAVIVSNVSPYKQWIKDGVNGLVVNPSRNGIDWFVQMRKLILNPAIREDLAGKLQETIKRNFDLDEHNLTRAKLYKQLTA